jgi:DNA replication protein
VNSDRQFPGFPAGRLKAIPIPGIFFSELMPVLDDLPELKVTLHMFWLVSQKKRPIGGVTLDELRRDTTLLNGLKVLGEDPHALLAQALNHTVERGTLLRIRTSGNGDSVQEWFFLNTESGRDLLNRVRQGEIDLGEELLLEEEVVPEEKPNIFVLYEQNIGLLQPLIVEELEEAETLYPMPWIEEAFLIAVEQNARNWRYIRAILERWQGEGKSDEEYGRDYRENGQSYLRGKHTGFIKH